MPHVFTVTERRVTFRYKDRFKYEDQWQQLEKPFTLKILGGRVVQPDDDERGPTVYNRVVAPRGVTLAEVQRALKDEYDSYGCHHEYDCCGCSSTRTDVKHIRGREFLMTRRVSYNI